MPPLDPRVYRVAWIAPLEIEVQAALCMLDKIHMGGFPVGPGDDYVFHAGEVSGHNVVVATFAAGQPYGTTSATSLASQVRNYFPNLWFGLLVGVAAGLPNLTASPTRDIRLGDVIIAMADGENPAIVPYGLGKQKGEAAFELLRSGHSVPQTERIVGSAIGKIKAEGRDTKAMLDQYKRMALKTGKFLDPGQITDCLYLPGEDRPVQRQQRSQSERNRVWYGAIGSGDRLLKSSRDRDTLRDTYNLIGLEMEAAGVMNEIPVGNIRGVCDYGDEQKNKSWQPYAAAMAAAFAKVVLMEIEAKPVLLKAGFNDVFTIEDKNCLKEILLTNPDDDRRRIEEAKGGLLDGAFRWVLDNPNYRKWFTNTHSHLLWIKGDAGKGKTMLMIGIIKELLQHPELESSQSLAYFLCQAADSKLNNAIAVLRGLIYMLVVQQPQLIRYLRQRYDLEGAKLLNSGNAFYSLSSILEDLINHSQHTTTYLLIDALDECGGGSSDLLRLIARTISTQNNKTKWLISSRNKAEIEHFLHDSSGSSKLSLELNASDISYAVQTYIDYGISQLGVLRHDRELEERVRVQLHQKSDNTFLWVSLVIQDLQKCNRVGSMIEMLEKIPRGLSALYERMVQQIRQLEDQDRALIVLILSFTILAYRPLLLEEMCCLVSDHDLKCDLKDLEAAVATDGSVLNIRDGRLYFVHQSAKDYFNSHASMDIFPFGRSKIHSRMFQQSLNNISTKLHRNMYRLDSPGVLASDIANFRPDPDPLAASHYSCTFWLDHFLELGPDTSARSESSAVAVVSDFFMKHLLHWFESLSLIGELPHGIWALRKLVHQEEAAGIPKQSQDRGNFPMRMFKKLLFKAKDADQPHSIFKEAERLANSYGSIIGKAPLQAYTATLVFCPQQSQSRNLYSSERLDFIEHSFVIQKQWDPYLQLWDEHSSQVNGVAFSPDGKLLASASSDCTIRLWDTATGLVKQVSLANDCINAIVFSPDGKLLAWASNDSTIQLWDTTCLVHQVIQGHTKRVNALSFSPDSKILASASDDCTVRLWDTNGAAKKVLRGHDKRVNAVVLSHDGKTLASASDDRTTKLWDMITGLLICTLDEVFGTANAVAFSSNDEMLVYASGPGILVYDLVRGCLIENLYRIFIGPSDFLVPHSGTIRALEFSHDGKTLASAADDCTLVLWDTTNWRVKRILQGHTDSIRAVAFSPNSHILASGSSDDTIRVWDISIGVERRTPRRPHPKTAFVFPRETPDLVRFSKNGDILATATYRSGINLWYNMTGRKTYLVRLINRSTFVFSPDTKILASASCKDGKVCLWDLARGKLRKTLQSGDEPVRTMAFSPNCKILATSSNDGTVRVWDIARGAVIFSFDEVTTALVFSDDGCLLTTEHSCLRLDSFTIQPLHTQKAARRITSRDQWISCDEERMILVPPGYEVYNVCNDIVVFRHFSGNTAFVKFRFPVQGLRPPPPESHARSGWV